MDNYNDFLLERLQIERKRFDRSGVYSMTQRTLAYNSNRIEGGALTDEQTASLFAEGTLPRSDDYYRAKDIEEMNGHFLMFNKMLDTLELPLTHELIKQFHFELKSGVFEDRAKGYAIGSYKDRPNMVGLYQTTDPLDVAEEMSELLFWYQQYAENGNVSIPVLAEFHARFECIHPFQDGNGRIGRLILFRECLKNSITPFIIEATRRNEYIEALNEYRELREFKIGRDVSRLAQLFEEERVAYIDKCRYYTEQQ